MNEERRTGERRGPSFITELPAPDYKLVTQVFSDLLTDRPAFVRQELSRMATQNYDLYDWLVNSCAFRFDGQRALDWALAYYAIHARATAPEGMVRVSGDLINATYSKEKIKIHQTKSNIQDYLEAQEKETGKMVDEEIKRSVGGAKFWGNALTFQFSADRIGHPSDQIQEILEPLYEMAKLLHSQVEVNKLRDKMG